MDTKFQPIIVERHLPLLPLGLVSPACCWAPVDDDLNYIFHVANGGGTIMIQNRAVQFSAPCALIVPAGEADGFHFAPHASGTAITITAAYLDSLLAREQHFASLFAAPVIEFWFCKLAPWMLAGSTPSDAKAAFELFSDAWLAVPWLAAAMPWSFCTLA